MRMVFAGTPEFAAESLKKLFQKGHEIPLVLTQPDRRSGRGMSPRPSPVKKLAISYGVQVLQPSTLQSLELVQTLRSVEPDIIVVVAYGLMVPSNMLNLPRFGCVNVHASLLPRWRGAAPIARAILAGDKESGISIMKMDLGLDTGPVFLQEKIDIKGDETAQSLHAKLAILGGESIVEAIQKIAQGRISPVPQMETKATYATKLSKDEGQINWNRKAEEIERAIRGYNPYPVARTGYDDADIRIWRAKIDSAAPSVPGEIINVTKMGICVACGQGAIRITELQRPGGKRMQAEEFLRGFPICPGKRFDAPT